MSEPKSFPKRFIAFEFEMYYPGGGMSDAVGSFDTLDEAKAARSSEGNFFQILDRETGDVVVDE